MFFIYKNRKFFCVKRTFNSTIHKKTFRTTAVRSDNNSLILVVADPATVAGVAASTAFTWYATIFFLSAATIIMTFQLIQDLRAIDQVGQVTPYTIALSRIFEGDPYDFPHFLDTLISRLSYYNVMTSELFRNVSYGIEVDEVRRLTAQEFNGLNLNLRNVQNNTNFIAVYYQRIVGVLPDWYIDYNYEGLARLGSQLNVLSGELDELIEYYQDAMRR